MKKMNLICVDDQQEVLNSVLQDLAPLQSWVNIEGCDSADEVLELMEELDSAGEHIALIISDHVMPNKNGVELLTEISQDSRFIDTKKILLTGQATHQDTINAINQARIESYIEKPWSGKALVLLATQLITEYIFDKGLEYRDYQQYLDSEVALKRLHQ